MNKQIAIIMPIHNTPAVLLNKTLESLKNQSFQNFRLICVDDASTENATLEMLEIWKEKYNNIEIIYLQENVGAARARNIGLDMAEEKYIMFLDSDDYFMPELLEKAYKTIEKNNAEVLFIGSIWTSDNETDKQIIRASSFNRLNGKIKDREFFRCVETVPWNKLINLSWLKKSGIKFQDIPCNNDIFFSMSVAILTDKYEFLDEHLINYRYNNKGSLTEKRLKNGLCKPLAYEQLIKWCDKNNLYNDSVEKNICHFILELIGGLLNNTVFSDECRKNTLCLLEKCNAIQEKLDRAYKKKIFGLADEIVYISWKYKIKCELEMYEYYIAAMSCLNKLFENTRKAVWGCGKIGHMVLQALQELNITVDYFIDSNEEKRHEYIGEYMIQSPDDAIDKVDVIFVAGKGISDSIQKIAGDKKIIDIHKFIFGE